MPRSHTNLARLRAFCVCLLTAFSVAAATAQSAAHAAPFNAECLGKGEVALGGDWQFHLGDDLAWAQPGVADATGHDGWETIQVDAPWGAQGHPNHTGWAWYRRHIHMSPAPDGEKDAALLIPAIDDIYEVYWNGVRVGGQGTFPPHIDFKFGLAAQTYGLGTMRDGVLAVRVLKLPFNSVDDGTAGGFEGLPHLGSPKAITLIKDSLDYHWLRRTQFRSGLTLLYVLTSLLSLFVWLRNRNQRLLFWLGIYTFMPLVEVLLNGMRLPISGIWLTVFIQTGIQFREVAQAFLLLYLLQLEDIPKLVRFLRIAAWITTLAGLLDGGLSFAFDLLSERVLTWADACFTALVLPAELLPITLVLIALLRRKRLDAARWWVASFAFALASWYSISNISLQGVRFTHWTLATWMAKPLFAIFGSQFSVGVVLRTLLFGSIVFAVVRYASEYRRRQSTLEQEYKNARELQRILVPESLPEIPGFRLSSAYQPAQEVGGDFFQIVPLEGEHTGSTMIVLGDVSGKGLKAAMTVSLIVGAIRTLVEATASPAEVLAGLNRRLSGRLEGGFATCVALRLDPDGICTVAGAGHPAPFLNDEELSMPGALPLGILPSSSYQELDRELQPGDHLALYTDGLLEARSVSGELYGFDRLTILFGKRASAEQASQEAIAFGQDDDITVLTLTCVGESGRAYSKVAAPALGLA